MPSLPPTRNAIVKSITSYRGDCAALKIYDLGSGWGGLCRKLSKYFPKATVIGYEISPIPYAVSKIVSFIQNHTITRANLFEKDISDANIIICYLSPYHMRELSKKLQSECKKGTLIYSQGFPIEDMTPKKIYDIAFGIERKLYCYEIN